MTKPKLNPFTEGILCIRAIREFTNERFTTGTCKLQAAKEFFDAVKLDATDNQLSRDYTKAVKTILAGVPPFNRQTLFLQMESASPTGLVAGMNRHNLTDEDLKF